MCPGDTTEWDPLACPLLPRSDFLLILALDTCQDDVQRKFGNLPPLVTEPEGVHGGSGTKTHTTHVNAPCGS